jgi:endogenous inhibitor of DNA gyrase (YacG/DUF329 family)
MEVICPICGEEGVKAFRPFCSKRCSDIDLGKWMSGSYAITTQSSDEDDQAELIAELEQHFEQKPN